MIYLGGRSRVSQTIRQSCNVCLSRQIKTSFVRSRWARQETLSKLNISWQGFSCSIFSHQYKGQALFFSTKSAALWIRNDGTGHGGGSCPLCTYHTYLFALNIRVPWKNVNDYKNCIKCCSMVAYEAWLQRSTRWKPHLGVSRVLCNRLQQIYVCTLTVTNCVSNVVDKLYLRKYFSLNSQYNLICLCFICFYLFFICLSWYFLLYYFKVYTFCWQVVRFFLLFSRKNSFFLRNKSSCVITAAYLALNSQ